MTVSIPPSAGAAAAVPVSTNPAESLLQMENRSDSVTLFYGLGQAISATDPALSGISIPPRGNVTIAGPAARMAVYVAHASGTAQDFVYRRSSPPVA